MSKSLPRILMIGRQFHPCIGGTESAMLEMARGLIKKGHEVGVLTLNTNFANGEPLPAEETVEGIRVHRLPFFGPRFKPMPACSPLKPFRIFKDYDIIHTQDIRFLWEHCLIAKLLQKKRLVISTHGFILHQQTGIFFKFLVFNTYLKPLFALSDSLLASSPQDYDKVKDRYKAPFLERFDLGVDAKRFASVRPQPQAGELLYFGRIDRHKGLDLLFDALAGVKQEWRLKIVFGAADPAWLVDLKQQAERLGIQSRIHWLGRLSQAELQARLESAQFVTLPSRYEGFGLTTLEAMSAGAVPIANRIQAFEHIITDGKNGFLVDFASREQATHTLSRLLSIDPTDLLAVSGAARARAGDFGWDRRIEQLQSVYGRIWQEPLLLASGKR